VLSEHYLRMVDHADDGVADGSDADDFLTLKRVNHKLSDDESGSDADAEGLRAADAENVSKRKLKMGASRKAMRKVRDAPLHLRFDDDGTARDAYEIRTADDEADAAARAAGQAHAEEQRARVAQADVRDRAEAKARKQEKKRKRRERERDVSRLLLHCDAACRRP
jgi:ATP-dependent RNA helicase DDX10/DBP4